MLELQLQLYILDGETIVCCPYSSSDGCVRKRLGHGIAIPSFTKDADERSHLCKQVGDNANSNSPFFDLAISLLAEWESLMQKKPICSG